MRGEDDSSTAWCRALRAIASAMAVHGVLLSVFVYVATRAGSRCLEREVTVPAPVLEDEGEDTPLELADEAAPSAAPSVESETHLLSFDARAPSRVSGSTVSGRGSGGAAEQRLRPARARAPSTNAAGTGPRESAVPLSGVTLGGPVGAAPLGLGLGATPNPFTAHSAPVGPGDTTREPRPGASDEGPYLSGPSAAEAKRSAESALREPARRRERELGLGPEGPVLEALGSATSASSAPVHGRALFHAVADGTGLIVGIDVVECDGARAGWAHAAELARAGLAGIKLRMPTSATRAELRVEITSTWKIPSGHDTGTDVSVFGRQTSKGDGKASSKVAVMDVLPKIRVVELSKDLKVPVVVVDPDVISIKGDSANSGANPRRIVHARLISSKVL